MIANGSTASTPMRFTAKQPWASCSDQLDLMQLFLGFSCHYYSSKPQFLSVGVRLLRHHALCIIVVCHALPEVDWLIDYWVIDCRTVVHRRGSTGDERQNTAELWHRREYEWLQCSDYRHLGHHATVGRYCLPGISKRIFLDICNGMELQLAILITLEYN